MSTFSPIAQAKMLDLYNNHAHEIGSKSPLRTLKPKLKPTDCITYVINVLEHTFNKTGHPVAAKQVRQKGAYGTELGKYLVINHHWKAIFYNPDVNHPRDGSLTHVLYYKKVENSCRYEGVPVSYMLINYRPTLKSNPDYLNFGKMGLSKKPTKPTALNNVTLDTVKKLKFAYGLSRGGDHTWLFSEGYVYEVHWDEIGANLYERTKLEDFQWLDGLILVPPDSKMTLLAGASCKTP